MSVDLEFVKRAFEKNQETRKYLSDPRGFTGNLKNDSLFQRLMLQESLNQTELLIRILVTTGISFKPFAESTRRDSENEVIKTLTP